MEELYSLNLYQPCHGIEALAILFSTASVVSCADSITSTLTPGKDDA